MQPISRTPQFQGWGIAGLRVVVGYLFLASGVSKLFSDPNELGISLPIAIGAALSLLELVGGAALIVGLLTRWVSVPLALLMLADILVFHPPDTVFEQDKGYEYALLRLAASVALALSGSGKVALDNILATRRGPI
jgi:putative oxidoreductase